MSESPAPQTSNVLGDNSLRLGITSTSITFLILLVSIVSAGSRFFKPASRVLFVADGFGAFLGFLGFVLGFAGLFGANKPRSSSVAGMFLGVLGAALFFAFMRAVR